jgi:redox-regulated HSP33 family molecular chaperone
MLQHYMLQSEQLDTVLVLAANTRWLRADDAAHACEGRGNLAQGHRTARTKTRLA